MHDNDSKRQIGEVLTQAELLAGGFWVLRRTPDVEGADFLVQIPPATETDLERQRTRINIMGIVQAKYFSPGTTVSIPEEYCLVRGVPAPEFFAFLHTVGEKGEPIRYFFTGVEICEQFRRVNGRFVFSLTQERNFENASARSRPEVWGIISSTIEQVEEDRNRELLSQIFRLFPSRIQHMPLNPGEQLLSNGRRLTWAKQSIEAGWQARIYDPAAQASMTVQPPPGDPSNFSFDEATQSWIAKPHAP